VLGLGRGGVGEGEGEGCPLLSAGPCSSREHGPTILEAPHILASVAFSLPPGPQTTNPPPFPLPYPHLQAHNVTADVANHPVGGVRWEAYSCACASKQSRKVRHQGGRTRCAMRQPGPGPCKPLAGSSRGRTASLPLAVQPAMSPEPPLAPRRWRRPSLSHTDVECLEGLPNGEQVTLLVLSGNQIRNNWRIQHQGLGEGVRGDKSKHKGGCMEVAPGTSGWPLQAGAAGCARWPSQNSQDAWLPPACALAVGSASGSAAEAAARLPAVRLPPTL
jgi:hypothetical protein